MADAKLDFYIDADDQYEPKAMPQGMVKMGGKEYQVHCPKDSLPMLLGRIEAQAKEAADVTSQEAIIRQIVAAVFEPEDTSDILERIVSPYESTLSIAFLMDTVRRVYEAYAPFLDEAYEDLGMENPVKEPQDRKPSTKTAAKRAPAKKTAARKTAATRRR